MNKKDKYDKLYLDIAKRVSEMSHATRKKVGAVIVKDGNIISFGWNGQPSGCDNSCEDANGVTLPTVIHAEQNALYKLARSGENAVGSTLYLTLSPCITCALGIIQSGISRVVYLEKYSKDEGIEELRKSGVTVAQYAKRKYEDDDLQFFWEFVRGVERFYGVDGLPTWIFDQIGRNLLRWKHDWTEDDRLESATQERDVEKIRIVLTDKYGEEIADHAIAEWRVGNHDT